MLPRSVALFRCVASIRARRRDGIRCARRGQQRRDHCRAEQHDGRGQHRDDTRQLHVLNETPDDPSVWRCGNGQTSPFAGRHRRTGKTSCRSNSVAARRSYTLVASLRSTGEAWRTCGGGVTDQQTGATASLHAVFPASTPVRLTARYGRRLPVAPWRTGASSHCARVRAFACPARSATAGTGAHLGAVSRKDRPT